MESYKELALLIPPVLALLIILYLKFKMPGGKFGLVYKAFLYGMISIVLVIGVQLLANEFGLDKLRNIRRIAFYAVVILGLFSEVGKYFFLRMFCYPSDRFNTPVDGIIYSVMIAMGFATMNSVFYFVDIPNVKVNLFNAATAGPANLIFGLAMGFFVGMGKMRSMRFIDNMTGLLAAIFFHSLYSFILITHDYQLMTAFFAGAAIIAFSLVLAALRMQIEAKKMEKKEITEAEK